MIKSDTRFRVKTLVVLLFKISNSHYLVSSEYIHASLYRRNKFHFIPFSCLKTKICFIEKPTCQHWGCRLQRSCKTGFAQISTSSSFSYLRANHITPREQAESGQETIIREIKEIHGNIEKLGLIRGSLDHF